MFTKHGMSASLSSLRMIALEKEFFGLSSKVYLVEGAVRGAIYNTNSGDIFSINEEATDYLAALVRGETIREVTRGINGQTDSLLRWLKQLEENSLGTFTEERLPAEELPPKPEQQLDFIWLELTKGCNLQCLHCYDKSGPDLLKALKGKEMQQEDWLRIIDQTAEAGARRMQFIGGEPLIYKGLFGLVAAAREREFEMLEIFTNGTLMDVPIADKIAELGVRVALSMYGNKPEIHDQVTKKEGSFTKTIRAINLLKERDVPVRVGIVAMSINGDYIDDTIKYVHETLGIDEVMVDIVRPVGRGCGTDLVPESLYKESLVTKAHFPKVSYRAFAQRVNSHPCWPGKLYICSNGEVLPCGMEQDLSLGNLMENSLNDVLCGPETETAWSLTKDQIDDCGICEYRYACFDCRPKSKEEGNFLAKPKECLYDPKEGVWGSREK